MRTYICFRPLAGIMVLINVCLAQNGYLVGECFRPLAGIMVLIQGEDE